jgi:hypothetical protein
MKDGKMDEDVVFKIAQDSFRNSGATLDEEKFKNGISTCLAQGKRHR